MFHVRRRPADAQPRRRKKKPLGISNGSGSMTTEREGPMLIEITHSGDGGRRVKLTTEPIEVGSANTNALQLFGPSIQPRHCLISLHEGVCTVTPLHADGLTFVNGHHITQPTILHNGSVVMFGRAASYRFVDIPSDGRYNLALSQSQLDSAYLYENRSSINPPSWLEDEEASVASSSYTKKQPFPQKPMQAAPQQQPVPQTQSQHSPGSNELKLNAQQLADDKSLFDNDGGNMENETKSVSSLRSQDSRSQSFAKPPTGMTAATPTMEPQGQEAILPAVLEFPEHHQEQFLKAVISDLDVNTPNFKLAPVYTLYLCARYRASTHYRPDLQPTERAHKLTVFLHHVANLIHNVIQEKYNDPKMLSFWMANSSEFLHFLKSDRHISAFSVQAQEVLAECVQTAFQSLVSIFQSELSQTLNQFLSENIDHDSAAGLVLSVLGSAMALLRRCRVNAALTIQLFSQLFHYINVVCFNKFVTTSHMCTSIWGKALSDRLSLLELWAEKQGLELAADCHLAKINQCAEFLQAPKTNVTEVQQLACSCFRLNSLQMSALLSQETIPRALIDACVRMAESVADELTRADGREIRLEESPDLPLALLLPVDGFSCDVVRGIPAGLVDFLTPYQVAGMCRLASQPTSIGLWTVYMHQFNGRSPSVMSTKMPQPEVQTIKLHKNSNGMGLSIVAAKGAGQDRLGIYIKSVVPGGAADADGRLQAGDQLLRVDGQSLIGITQERAADYLVRTGPVVSLEVAKQGAIYHGLATLLQQPSPVIQRGGRRMSERDMSRVGADAKPGPSPGPQLMNNNSKSVPTLHNIGNGANKSRSIHNLSGPSNSAGNINTTADQGFYQNLSVYRQQNQSQPNLGENRAFISPPTSAHQLASNSSNNITAATNMINRPASALFNNNNSNVMNQSPSNPNIPHSTSTGNLMQPNPSMMVGYSHMPPNASTPPTHISHPNLSGNHVANSPIPTHRPPMPPNKMLQAQQQPVAFLRESQSQHSLRMNQHQQQMMAPSMPNIAHAAAGYPIIPASQSMQNVNQIPNNHPMYHPQQPPQQFADSQFQPSHQQLSPGQQHHNALIRGQAKIAEMGEFIKRQQRNQQLTNGVGPIHFANSMDNIHIPQNQMPSPAQNFQPQSPQKQLPPTAPKPQRHHMESDSQPPLPPTSTHPLFKNTTAPQSHQQQNSSPAVNYSSSDAPKMGLYPNSNAQQHASQQKVNNPWEREEREKEHEMRREQMRHWRDQQIVELSLLPSRSQQQEEQLKSLVLERDFERRAQEDDNEEENVQDVPRLHPTNGPVSQASQQVPTSRLKQVEIKTTPNNISPNSSESQSNDNHMTNPPPIQPKSILKSSANVYNGSNPSSPSKAPRTASFASQNLTEITMNNTTANQMITQLNKDLGDLTIEYQEETMNGQPPPPPERGSSYAVMNQKVRANNFPKISFNDQINNNSNKYTPAMNNINNNNNNNNDTSSMMMSPTGTFTAQQIQQQLNLINNNSNFVRDNKRVSFHDHENNNNEIVSEHDLSMVREDPNRFIDETTAMLQTPTTPDGDTSWETSVQSTPGVIGAQEVYRDPRTRRLAEKQQQQKADAPVPEKLSFKEKMKMFALESGENTPKDKLKISRAQRDIDAVH